MVADPAPIKWNFLDLTWLEEYDKITYRYLFSTGILKIQFLNLNNNFFVNLITQKLEKIIKSATWRPICQSEKSDPDP